MDFLKKAAGELQGKSSSEGQSGQAAGAAPAGTTQTQDYGDKAFDFISKKAGHDFSPEQDEKITDGLRMVYEKATGSKVDQKYSN